MHKHESRPENEAARSNRWIGAKVRWQSEAGQRGREHSASVLVRVALERKRGAGRLLVGGRRAFALAVYVEGEHGVPEERVGGHPKHTHVRREQQKVNGLRERPVAEVELLTHFGTLFHTRASLTYSYSTKCTRTVFYSYEY